MDLVLVHQERFAAMKAVASVPNLVAHAFRCTAVVHPAGLRFVHQEKFAAMKAVASVPNLVAFALRSTA